jgi:hypothetical protein
MWATYPPVSFQPRARLLPVETVAGWDNPTTIFSGDRQLHWSENQPYSWKGVLRAAHSRIGAVHATIAMNQRPIGTLPIDGALGDSFEMRFGSRYAIRLQRRYRSLWPNGGTFAERSAWPGHVGGSSFNRPYASGHLNPPTSGRYFWVDALGGADCFTQVSVIIDGTAVRQGILRSQVNNDFPNPDVNTLPPTFQYSACVGFVRLEDRRFIYCNVVPGGYGSQVAGGFNPSGIRFQMFGEGTVSWVHEISDDELTYLDGPLDLYSSNGAFLYSIALKYGDFVKCESALPDDPAAPRDSRFLRTFAAYRHKYKNFCCPLTPDTTDGIAQIDCGASKAIANANALYSCAVQGYDLGDTAIAASDTSVVSNVSHSVVENARLKKMRVTLPQGAVPETRTDPGTRNPNSGTSSQSPQASVTCTNQDGVNNSYWAEQPFEWECRDGFIDTIVNYTTMQAFVSLSRTDTTTNRSAAQMELVAFDSAVTLYVRLLFGATYPPTQWTGYGNGNVAIPTSPGPFVMRDWSAAKTLTTSERNSLVAGDPITITGFGDPFGRSFLQVSPNPVVTVQAVGP